MPQDSYLKDCAKFLQKLVQTPSVNGRDSEAAVVRLIVAEAEKLKLPHKILEKQKGRPNIFVGERFSSNKEVLFVAHLDTVPEGDRKAWKHPPFSGKIVQGKLFGRGAFDCKGGIATSLYALKALYDAGNKSAKFIGVADEESGADSEFGLKYVLSKGLRAKGAVYTYGSGKGKNSITIGHRGVIRLWITCEGEAAHSGSLEWQKGERGKSAIAGIMEFLERLQDFKMPGENKYFPGYDFVLTPTLISGGAGESIVPAEAKVLIDIRTLPEHDNKEIIKKIQKIAKELSAKKRRYSVEIKNNIPAALTAPDSDFVKRTLAVTAEVYGMHNPSLKGSGPANEGYVLIEHGIPTVVGFGPQGDGFHSKDEYVEVASLEKSIRFLAHLAR